MTIMGFRCQCPWVCGYVLLGCLSVTDTVSVLAWVLWGVDMISTGNRELRCPMGGVWGAVTQIV